MNHVVIMAGGIGSRFWPLSTPDYPKQFIDILGVGRTLIQMTVDRFSTIAEPANFWVVTNAKYVDIVREQLPMIPAENILAEPAARNTAPCIAWACWEIRKADPEANIVVTPSDAIVMNPMEFQHVINNALNFTGNNNAIVTIGIKPNRPETGYGYVQFNANENDDDSSATKKTLGSSKNIKKVAQFKEKPNLETAKQYLASGNYLWNAGIFVFSINTMVSALTKNKPQIASLMDAIVSEVSGVSKVQELFPLCEKVSIDYAVMEPAAAEGLVYTHPADFGWSDLGNWQSLHEKLKKDGNNNAVVGNVKLVECHDCVVHIEGKKSSPFKGDKRGSAILQGLDGYIVSEKGGQILVCKRSEEQRIKEWNE